MIRIAVFCAQDQERKSFNAELAEFNGGHGEIVPVQADLLQQKVSPSDGWSRYPRGRVTQLCEWGQHPSCAMGNIVAA